RKWRDQMVVVEVVIETKVLLVIDAMVQTDSELIAADRLHRRAHHNAAVIDWRGHQLKQVDGGGIQTCEGNNVLLTSCHVCKKAGVGSRVIRVRAIGDTRTKCNARLTEDGLATPRTLLQREITVQSTSEWRLSGEIRKRLSRAGTLCC